MMAGTNKPYRVLSIDGGGIRGLYTAVLLHGVAQRFARSCGKSENRLDVGRQFDLIVGTSTGAILAAALAAGVSLEEVIHLYRQHAGAIFQNPVPASRPLALGWLVKHALSPANNPDALREALEEVLKAETLGQVYTRRKVALCVPAVDVETLKAWVFKTPHDTKTNRLQRDNHYRLVDICMASAAAPLVFPIAGTPKPNDVAGNTNWFVDGGLWANNPVVVALVEAITMAPDDVPIQLVSISTCPPFKGGSVSGNSANRGVLGWHGGVRILEAAIDAQSYAYDYMARTLAQQLGREVDYVRLRDPDVSAEEAVHLRLDNPATDCLERLVKLGNRAVDLNISDATTGNPPPRALLAKVFADVTPLA